MPGEADPLSMFPAERVDLALQRLYHYTGTAPEHFQRFVLFTNYQRYVDEFIELGRSHMAAEHDDGNGYVRFVEPGDVVQERGGAVPDDAARPRACRRCRPTTGARRQAGRDAGQHRRRPVERQDHDRPPPCCVRTAG